jgi:hypothetical protein
VQDGEYLLYAVFATTPFNPETRRLQKEAFTTKQLVRTEVSVTRKDHTARDQFVIQVVEPATKTTGSLVGVARVTALTLREMFFSVPNVSPEVRGRAICVLDKVSPYDFDGHAALGYSEHQQTLTTKQRATIRELIRADLADAFGEISPLDAVFETFHSTPRPEEGSGPNSSLWGHP